jgi:hypothetical protein
MGTQFTRNTTEADLTAMADTLAEAFSWETTAPGYSYWIEVHLHLRRLQHECQREGPAVSLPPKGSSADRIKWLHQRIMDTFTWSTSPQGSEYWQRVRVNLEKVFNGMEEGEGPEKPGGDITVTMISLERAALDAALKRDSEVE